MKNLIVFFSILLILCDVTNANAITQSELSIDTNKSLGSILVNQKTKESLRLVCVDNNEQYKECEHYSLITSTAQSEDKSNDAVITQLSSKQLKNLRSTKLSKERFLNTQQKLNRLHEKGYKFFTIKWKTKNGNYAFGTGLTQLLISNNAIDGLFLGFIATGFLSIIPVGAYLVSTLDATLIISFTWLPIAYVSTEIGTEIAKLALNTAIYPVKVIYTLLRSLKLKKMEQKIDIANKILNFENDNSLKSKILEVSPRDYRKIKKLLIQLIKTTAKQ